MNSHFIEDLIKIFTMLNKISIIAFVITLIFLAYEIYLLKKDKPKKNILVIPNFEGTTAGPEKTFVKKGDENNTKTYRTKTPIPLIIAFILTVLFGIISLFGFVNTKKMEADTKHGNKESAITFITSNGIRVYTTQWKELRDDRELNTVLGGETLYIGVETIPEADIDRARIRVNKNNWSTEDITLKYNGDKEVFYQEYVLASQASKLRIEAQLHSKTDGWLGD